MTDESNHNFHTELHGVTAHWQLPHFLSLKLKNGEFLYSPIFQETSEASWKIRLYPEGDGKEEIGYISVYLHLNSANEFPVSATWSISIKVRDKILGKTQLTYKFDSLCGFGNPQFLERSELMESLESTPACKSVTIECTVRLLDKSSEIVPKLIPCECPCQRSDNCMRNLTNSFGDIFISKEHCDVKINVGTKCYDAHKTILSARSKVFSSMFKHEMAETLNGTIDISDCDPESFGVFLEFLYTGKLDKVIYSNSISVYKIADKYGLKDLQEQCCLLLSEGLEIDLICDVLDFATTYGESKLLEKATVFFILKRKEIFSSEKWFNLLIEKPSLANELLKQLAEKTIVSP